MGILELHALKEETSMFKHSGAMDSSSQYWFTAQRVARKL
jgi:hypothetical protein